MSRKTNKVKQMSTQRFAITRELLSGYHQAGLTISEMAEEIRKASGYPCSVYTIRAACQAYGINNMRKPRKSPFVFGDSVQVVPNNTTSNHTATDAVSEEVREEEEVRTQTGVSF